MNEEALKALIYAYKPMLENESTYEHGLLSLVKDVERITRNRSVSIAQKMVLQLSESDS